MGKNFDSSGQISELSSANLALKTNRNFHEYLDFLRLGINDLQGKKILDLGSGSQSAFAIGLRENRVEAEIVSLDVGFETEQVGAKDNVVGLFSSLPFKDESFDMVLSVAAMPLYIHDESQAKRALTELARVLNAGGKAYLSPVYYTKIGDPESSDTLTSHEKYFEEETLEMLRPILNEIEGISYEFFEEIYYGRGNRVPGKPKHEPSLLVLKKVKSTK